MILTNSTPEGVALRIAAIMRDRTNPPGEIDIRPAAKKLGVSLQDIAHYSEAVTRWTAAGFPMRAQTEVERLHAICLACEEHVEGRCKQCGCQVSDGWFPLTNKIKMATEDCTLGKWKPPTP